MREIRFRAWNEKRQEMYRNAFPMFGDYILTADDPGVHMPIAEGVLLQFTGLKDKNGKDIYEGDILKIQAPVYTWKLSEPGIVEVIWMGAGFYPLCHDLSPIERSEIIGNIYQSPELLNDKAS